MAVPRMKRGTLRMRIMRPVSNPRVWWKMMAMPLTPPEAIFAGPQKRAMPMAVKSEPTAMYAIS